MTFDCNKEGHHFQQLLETSARPIFVFCTQCGQLLRYDLDQATINGLKPVSSVPDSAV